MSHTDNEQLALQFPIEREIYDIWIMPIWRSDSTPPVDGQHRTGLGSRLVAGRQQHRVLSYANRRPEIWTVPTAGGAANPVNAKYPG
jgi:hypothetical protein